MLVAMSDPRPLTGEPLAVDLLNTVWVDGGVRYDLLEMPDGLAAWGHQFVQVSLHSTYGTTNQPALHHTWARRAFGPSRDKRSL